MVRNQRRDQRSGGRSRNWQHGKRYMLQRTIRYQHQALIAEVSRRRRKHHLAELRRYRRQLRISLAMRSFFCCGNSLLTYVPRADNNSTTSRTDFSISLRLGSS